MFAVRGGWGCARLLPFLDWDVIRANPKLLVGFSDITALHLAFAARAGFPTIHAPERGKQLGQDQLGKLLAAGLRRRDARTVAPPEALERSAAQRTGAFTTLRPGKARGRLLGGNLSVLSALVGTPWLPDFDGAILFLEDVGEAEYRIDRMLSQLALAGILRQVAGVVFGQCTRCTAGVPDYGGFTVPQVLEQHLAPLGVPAFGGANFGHVGNQLSLPVGISAEIDANSGTIRILEPAAA